MGSLRLLLVLLVCLAGCGQASPPAEREGWLIRVADGTRSVSDFRRAMEVAKMAYPHNALRDPAVVKAVRRRVLSQMAEELLLAKVAVDNGIAVSDEALRLRAERFKADYPEGEFEKTLLANAVSERAWMASLRTRILMERVIDEVLGAAVAITPEEIGALYAEYDGGADLRESESLRGEVVKRLRRKKAEALYGEWLAGLKREYPVEVNGEKWDAILEK